MKYEVDFSDVDRFYYRRVRSTVCATREEAVALAIEMSKKLVTATLFATDASGTMTATMFVYGKVHGKDHVGVGAQ